MQILQFTKKDIQNAHKKLTLKIKTLSVVSRDRARVTKRLRAEQYIAQNDNFLIQR